MLHRTARIRGTEATLYVARKRVTSWVRESADITTHCTTESEPGESFMQSPVAVAALKSLAGTGRFRRSEEGQDLLEYGLLAALIALIALGAVTQVGNVINTVFWSTIAAAA